MKQHMKHMMLAVAALMLVGCTAPIAAEWIFLCIGIPLIISGLGASIGFLVFWRPARPLYFTTAILVALLTPLGGPYVMSGWMLALYAASCVFTGVVLALIYFSPLKDLYDKQSSAAGNGGEPSVADRRN